VKKTEKLEIKNVVLKDEKMKDKEFAKAQAIINTGLFAGRYRAEIDMDKKRLGWACIRLKSLDMEGYHDFSIPFFTIDDFIALCEKVRKSKEYVIWQKWVKMEEVNK
jgi:hypothetical protein